MYIGIRSLGEHSGVGLKLRVVNFGVKIGQVELDSLFKSGWRFRRSEESRSTSLEERHVDRDDNEGTGVYDLALADCNEIGALYDKAVLPMALAVPRSSCPM